MTELCVMCDKLASTKCTRCDATLYSSDACLRSDVENHDLVCTSFGFLPPLPAMDGKCVLGILFPGNDTRPELVWVPISGFADGDTGISFEEAEIGSYFDPTAVPERLYSERNRVRNRDTRSMLEAWHATSGTANKCIKAMGGNGDGPFYDWRGSVLVLAMTRPTGFMVDPGAYKNAEPADFRDAADFLLDHGNDLHGNLLRQTLGTLGGRPAELGASLGSKAVQPANENGGGNTIVAEME
ncbi:hypothetical protein B0T16DRAFT_139430 [Cercophora newfieldiana]|uniref:MYND-type zinc finger protein samB n=1 Tax=Cercophora newfieldiana TaxID=92897 RepID=A0AA39YCY7_9PEZI|nr:hypothetical protein B0T16DRAFT_139430 [Cercophora newfieldiana]